MKFVYLLLLACFGQMAVQAYAGDDTRAQGICYADSHCQRPLSDQVVTASECGRMAGLGRYKRMYLVTYTQNWEKFSPGRCTMVYNEIVPRESAHQGAACFPYGTECNDALPCCSGSCVRDGLVHACF